MSAEFLELLPAESERAATFPETKYMGSKRRLLPFIAGHLAKLRFSTVLDAFSGTSCVAHMLKNQGREVTANDFLSFCYHIANATIENDSILLTQEDITGLVERDPGAGTFIRDTFPNLYFDEKDKEFLDNLWANICKLPNEYKKSLALAAANRACMKKRPRGQFTTTGRKGWDARADLKLSMHEQFVAAINGLNAAVFSNGRNNKALHRDVFEIDGEYDLVYLDPPYISKYSDCDYTRRYHFVEGFCSYWQDTPVMPATKTQKIASYPTAFSSRAGAVEAFRRTFDQFKNSILVVSYSSNGIPSKEEICELLRSVKNDVSVFEQAHRYHHGNHNHRVGSNNNMVSEYLFVAS